MVEAILDPPLRQTRTDKLRSKLAEEIASGRLAPGTPLDEMELARRFGVSRTPVREAIRNLAASGLVETRPHRGALVAHPSPARLADMIHAMAELEALCAGLAAIHMTADERRRLLAIHHELREMNGRTGPADYTEGNSRFHDAIYSGAHNAYLAELARMTRNRVAPFQGARLRHHGRFALSVQEHDRVVEAILGGDRPGAAHAMRFHIEAVYDAYRGYSVPAAGG